MNNKKHSCTIFFPPNNNAKPRKYRYVNKIQTFLKFAANAGGWYVNIYDRESGLFLRREYLLELDQVKKMQP